MATDKRTCHGAQLSVHSCELIQIGILVPRLTFHLQSSGRTY
jgi:hypothetical protein